MKPSSALRTLQYLALAMHCLVAAAQQPAPKPAQPFGQPLVPDLVADPSIAEIDGTFYLFATTDGVGADLASAGKPVVWQSKDFLHWHFEGSIFSPGFDAKYWAPSEPVARGGVFHLFPTLDEHVSHVVAPTPAGPYTQPDGRPVNRAAGLAAMTLPVGKPIDAQTFTDDDGSVYMVWAQRGIARLKPDLSAIDGEATAVPTKRQGYSEGPLLFKRRGIYYYLYTLEGHENYRYAYMMSRSSALGPWEAPEQDLVAVSNLEAGVYGPGHGCVVNPRGTDDWYLVYLEFGRGGTTRQIYADPLRFNPDGTIRPVSVSMQGVGALRNFGPLKPNLAAHAIASASSTRPPSRVVPRALVSLDRTEAFDPRFAIDGSNGSRWMADTSDAVPTLTLDLRQATRLERVELFFVMPTGGHAYRLEYSLDARDWKLMGAETAPSVRSPHVVEAPVVARYLRVAITSGVPGVWEFTAFGTDLNSPLQLGP
ncbi:family 43 glycosylhydrolase [Roseateles saccharophilus]|uniref:F5/8 type C domain-containing protein n=1 Tax=Roseateles saccharophilus TaxID=304 RepID=A0A4R3VJI2_ROSSA|nr:family 43 glycosylhydrolase [Roseateles saccharophilus]MDG0832532.1 glycosyl hydrolase family 43 [Roseateles saccharophilus]TCV03994.1 F5/8 type C domain-containing protein [Roseateles saccharophilus]